MLAKCAVRMTVKILPFFLFTTLMYAWCFVSWDTDPPRKWYYCPCSCKDFDNASGAAACFGGAPTEKPMGGTIVRHSPTDVRYVPKSGAEMQFASDAMQAQFDKRNPAIVKTGPRIVIRDDNGVISDARLQELSKLTGATIVTANDCHPPNIWNGKTCVDGANPTYNTGAAFPAVRANDCHPPNVWNGKACVDAANPTYITGAAILRVDSDTDGKVKCTSSLSGKTAACNGSHIAQLNKALAGASNSGVKSLALAKDGSLMCATSSGTGPCTAAHLPDLKRANARVNSETEKANQTAPASRK